MATKVDRDVFYLEKYNKNKMINLQINKVAPRHRAKNQDRGYPCLLLEKGSLTVEASFCATAFFLALFSLLTLFQMLAEVHKIQMCLANTVWQYETLGTKLGTVEGLLKNSILIQWDEEEEICFVKRKEEIPFIGSRFLGISFYQQMKFNTYAGRSMVSGGANEEGYVYIAQNGSVYHKDKDCVYLNPNVQSVKHQRVSRLRNDSGSKYKHCKSCCGETIITDSMLVYLTPYGEHFHISKNCSGLKRTIRRVEVTKVGNMPMCSKCAEEEG